MFIRRLGQSNVKLCESGHHCPQILEMSDGDFAAVSADMTAEAIPALPPGPGVGPKERMARMARMGGALLPESCQGFSRERG